MLHFFISEDHKREANDNMANLVFHSRWSYVISISCYLNMLMKFWNGGADGDNFPGTLAHPRLLQFSYPSFSRFHTLN